MKKLIYEFLLILLYSTISLFFYDSGLGFLVFILGIFLWTFIIFLNRGNKFIFLIMKLLIFSLPFSFVSIFGQSLSTFPISWFHIFVFIYILYFLLLRVFNKNIVLNVSSIIFVFFLLIAFTVVLNSNNFNEAFSQYLHLLITILLLLPALHYDKLLTSEKIKHLIHSYILMTIIASLGVITQYLSLNLIGESYGFFIPYGGGREAIGYLFSDFSFLSLFIASGIVVTYFMRKHFDSNAIWLLVILVLLIGSIMTTARTGVISFLILFAFYSFFKLFKLLYNGDILKGIGLVLFQLLMVLALFMLSTMRENILTSDTGRAGINDIAFSVFLENPIFGFGFGGDTYRDEINTVVPHNIIFQALAQGGLIYTIPLLVVLGIIIYKVYMNKSILLPAILLILIGALFIPSIFASRFLGVLILIALFDKIKINKSILNQNTV